MFFAFLCCCILIVLVRPTDCNNVNRVVLTENTVVHNHIATIDFEALLPVFLLSALIILTLGIYICCAIRRKIVEKWCRGDEQFVPHKLWRRVTQEASATSADRPVISIGQEESECSTHRSPLSPTDQSDFSVRDSLSGSTNIAPCSLSLNETLIDTYKVARKTSFKSDERRGKVSVPNSPNSIFIASRNGAIYAREVPRLYGRYDFSTFGTYTDEEHEIL